MTRSKLFALASLSAATCWAHPPVRSSRQPPPVPGRPRPPRRPAGQQPQAGHSRARSKRPARRPEA